MVWVTKKEAADCLGISIDTIDRRLKRGELRGKQQARPQGFTWLIEVPDETYNHGAKEESPPLGTPGMTSPGGRGCGAETNSRRSTYDGETDLEQKLEGNGSRWKELFRN